MEDKNSRFDVNYKDDIKSERHSHKDHGLPDSNIVGPVYKEEQDRKRNADGR